MTNGAEAIQLAYRTAEQVAVRGAVNRVILATDGDFNGYRLLGYGNRRLRDEDFKDDRKDAGDVDPLKDQPTRAAEAGDRPQSSFGS